MFLSRKFLYVLVFLSAAHFFTGCSMGDNEIEDTGFIPAGIWDSGFDSYEITNNSLYYFMEGSEWEGVQWPPTILKGNIAEAVDFSANAGVLIIRVSEASSNTVGSYTGVYYRDFTGSSIRLATAIGPAPDFLPIEVTSLSAALSLFTVDNSIVHIIDWSIIAPYNLRLSAQ